MPETEEAGRTRGPTSSTARVLLIGGLVLALAATVALVFSDSVQGLRLGVIAALWAALAGAFIAAHYRKDVQQRDTEIDTLHTVYELELEREVAARREHELAVEANAYQKAERDNADTLASLQRELQSLRQTLRTLLGGEVLVERVALHAQSTRMRSIPENAHQQRRAGDVRPSRGAVETGMNVGSGVPLTVSPRQENVAAPAASAGSRDQSTPQQGQPQQGHYDARPEPATTPPPNAAAARAHGASGTGIDPQWTPSWETGRQVPVSSPQPRSVQRDAAADKSDAQAQSPVVPATVSKGDRSEQSTARPVRQQQPMMRETTQQADSLRPDSLRPDSQRRDLQPQDGQRGDLVRPQARRPGNRPPATHQHNGQRPATGSHDARATDPSRTSESPVSAPSASPIAPPVAPAASAEHPAANAGPAGPAGPSTSNGLPARPAATAPTRKAAQERGEPVAPALGASTPVSPQAMPRGSATAPAAESSDSATQHEVSQSQPRHPSRSTPALDETAVHASSGAEWPQHEHVESATTPREAAWPLAWRPEEPEQGLAGRHAEPTESGGRRRRPDNVTFSQTFRPVSASGTADSGTADSGATSNAHRRPTASAAPATTGNASGGDGHPRQGNSRHGVDTAAASNGASEPYPHHQSTGRSADGEPTGEAAFDAGAHVAGRAVSELLAAHGVGGNAEAPRRRRRREELS